MTDVVVDLDPVALPHPEVAAMPADRQANLATARLIGRSLTLCAQRLGVPMDGVGFDDLSGAVIDRILERLLATGQIDAVEYRAIHQAREVLLPR